MNNINTPSLNQGYKYKKKDKKKEGFTNLNISDNGITKQSLNVLNETNISNKTDSINEIVNQYKQTLSEYQNLLQSISGNTENYLQRTSPSNPYLNKVIKFPTGEYSYVTNQGVAKYIPNTTVLNSLGLSSSNIIGITVPWDQTYTTPGNTINTTPSLITGTPIQLNQSVGNEGNNIFVDTLVENSTATYLGCYADNTTSRAMTFVGGTPSSGNYIQNNSFSQPQISANTYSLINSSTQVPYWSFNAYIFNSYSNLANTTPYPNGLQCACIYSTQNFSQTVSLNTGITYVLSFSAFGYISNNSSNTLNVLVNNTSVYNVTPDNSWNTYSTNITVNTSGTVNILFQGSNIQSYILIQNIQLLVQGSATSGSYTYDTCKQEAINLGYQYFALQNVNTSTNLGYCAVSQLQTNATQYGTSYVPNAQVVLWSSSTSGQTGNTAILTTTGMLSVINSSGTSVYSTPYNSNAPSNYLGCYADSSAGRAMPLVNNGSQSYTNTSCKNTAQSQGQGYYGLQYYSSSSGQSQCGITNTMQQALEYGKATNCTQLSDGSWSGGGWSNAVYNTNSPESNYYLILQDDGNMVIYRGTGPNDNQGVIWASNTQNLQQQANTTYAAVNGKYSQNWIASGSTLAPGDFVGSTNGNLALIMQTDGNLVLYTFKNTLNCQKMTDGNMGGGVNANALYQLSEVGVPSNMGQLAYIDANSELHTYPSSQVSLSNKYTKLSNTDSSGNDIDGVTYGNATVEQCSTTCNELPNCYGFVFNTEGNVCKPKSSGMYPIGQKQYDVNSSTYIRERQPTSPPLGVPQNSTNTNSVTYQNYVNGGNFSSSYGLANATESQKQQLATLEQTLNELASKLSGTNTKLSNYNNLVGEQSFINLNGINKYLFSLKNTDSKINNITNDKNVSNILKDSDIVVLQENYEYLFWASVAFGVVLVSMNILK